MECHACENDVCHFSVLKIDCAITMWGPPSRSLFADTCTHRSISFPGYFCVCVGIAAGGAGAALLLTVVCLLMLCVYRCAKRGSHESECVFRGREGEGGGADFRLLCTELRSC